MSNSNPQKKKSHKYFTTNTAIFLLILALLLSLLYPIWSAYQDRMLAHHALREAKNVQLSIRLISTEYYAQNTTPISTTTSSGLKKEAEEEVLKLSESDGELRVTKWGKGALVPEAFDYQTGSYLVSFSHTESGEEQWRVSKIKKIISLP